MSVEDKILPHSSKKMINSDTTAIIAGRIQHFTKKWRGLTQDSFILSAVTGYKIQFVFQPVQFVSPGYSLLVQ